MKNQAGNYQFGSTTLPFSKVHFIDSTNIKDEFTFALLKKVNFEGFHSLVTRLESVYQTTFFFVGGCVRDLFLEKEPKDIDIIIPHIDINELSWLLSIYGDVDLVGKSFGVLKFKPFGSDQVIDVSVPRVEKSTGEGHKDFEVIATSSVTLEEDLKRRDFTMNALAMTYNGYIFDPFGGIKDIENKVIGIISNNSFVEDPLRMLRALQFSARFGFTLAHETIDSFIDNVELLKNISGERILIELEKGITGDVFKFSLLLWNFGVWSTIFGEGAFFDNNSQELKKVKTIAEFLFMGEVTPELAKEKLKISSKDAEELQSLILINELIVPDNRKSVIYGAIFNRLQKSPQIINTEVLSDISVLEPFQNGEFPKSFKELSVNGDDIMKFGFEGKSVGLVLKVILENIFAGVLTNDRNQLLDWLKSYVHLKVI